MTERTYSGDDYWERNREINRNKWSLSLFKFYYKDPVRLEVTCISAGSGEVRQSLPGIWEDNFHQYNLLRGVSYEKGYGGL